MKNAVNEPISYDDHGDIPLHIPFHQIPSQEISIYLQLNTKVGKSTCQQTCSHCFFSNQPETRGRSMDLTEGRRVKEDLEQLGYIVFPMISDSFANRGEFLRLFSHTHIRDYRQEMDRKLTKTMERGEMWTSGAPLLGEDWMELLSLGVENGFGSVSITYHGMLDKNLRPMPPETYPIKRVFYGQECERVIARIHSFNAALLEGKSKRLSAIPVELRQPLQINMGVTIGKHNHTFEMLLRYIRYFDNLKVSVVRFNRFQDHGWNHPNLPLSREEIVQFYRDLKWIHTHISFGFQLGVDEDFGTSGIEVMGFPNHTGWCRAGRQLFAIVPDEVKILEESQKVRQEKVGTIAACVDAFKPVVGHLVRITTSEPPTIRYKLEFYHNVIDELNRKRMEGTYIDGCFATELLAELRSAELD